MWSFDALFSDEEFGTLWRSVTNPEKGNHLDRDHLLRFFCPEVDADDASVSLIVQTSLKQPISRRSVILNPSFSFLNLLAGIVISSCAGQQRDESGQPRASINVNGK